MPSVDSLSIMYNHIIEAIVGLVPKTWADYCAAAVLFLLHLFRIALPASMNADAAEIGGMLSSFARNAVI